MNRITLHSTARYLLEPGNGTRYEFSITTIEEGNFIELTIHMGGGINGSYSFERSQLLHVTDGYVRYAASKMPGIRYGQDVGAIMRAVSALLDDPSNLDEACQAIMEAYK